MSLLLVLAPIVIACVRGISGGWVPEGDEAIVLIRSRDLFGGHPPLLGMSSTAGQVSGLETNHPGPLLFWVLAPATTIGHGTTTSLLLAIAALTGGAAATMVLVGARCAGAAGAAVVAIGVLLLERSLGAPMLRDPLNSAVVILPMGAAMALAAGALHDGRRVAGLAVFASIPMQAYTAYALPSVACLGIGAVALLRLARAERALAIRRSLWAAAALAACWLPAAVEQLTGDQHNMSRIITAAAADADGIGLRTALSRAAWALAPIPVAARTGELVPEPFDVPDATWAVALLLLAVATSTWWGPERGRPYVRPMATTSVAVGVAGILATARLPTVVAFRGDPFWWLWPWSLLVALTAIAQVAPWVHARTVTLVRRSGLPADQPAMTIASLVAMLLLAIALTPTAPPSADPSASSRQAIRALVPPILDALEPGATYAAVPDGFGAMASILPGVLAAMDAHGVELAMTRAVSGTLGDRITSDDPATGGILVVRVDATEPVPGARLLATTSVDGHPVDAWLLPPTTTPAAQPGTPAP